MQPLTDEFLNNCPVDKGFRMRGMAMTRIEVFVDAAFAFAVTMLVISIDQIPNSLPELIEISKFIPGFIMSVAQLTLIWHFHSTWSKKFGLEDGQTVILSISLVVVMLIFIYPLKMMYQGMFAWISDGFLPSQFTLQDFNELRMLFYYFAIGFFLVSVIFMALYWHAIKSQKQLQLSAFELFQTNSKLIICLNMAATCLLALLLPYWVSDKWVPLTGFTYILLVPSSYYIQLWRAQYWLKNSQL